jgi:hypothetical protein
MNVLRRVLWALAGAVLTPAAVFALVVVFLGGAGVCKGGLQACDISLGLAFFSAPLFGAILFWMMSGARPSRQRSDRFFGRGRRSDGLR